MITPLLALGLAGVVFWLLRDPGAVAQESPSAPQAEVQDLPEPEERVPAPEPQDFVAEAVSAAAPAPSLPSSVLPSSARCSTNELMAILPLWMQEEAAVDAYADELVVAGIPVVRVRGRYAWPNGSLMEVEISDLGEAPSDLLLRSLGYNTAASNTVTEAGFSVQVDGANDPTRFEYDYGTEEGSMQVLVADRFLVEVQLGLLLQESFETVIQHQVPIAALQEIAAKSKTPSGGIRRK